MLANGHEADLLKSNKDEYDAIYAEFIKHLYVKFKVDSSEQNTQKAFKGISNDDIKKAYDEFVLPKMTQSKSKQS